MFRIVLSKTGFSQLKQTLIENSLAYVHKYGWNDRAIHAACVALDLSPAAHRLITPYQLVTHCMAKWNMQALRKLDDSNFDGKRRIGEKVELSIKTRLQLQAEYADTWHEAMRLGAHPDNLSTTKDMLWSYSDEVWRRCGDTSTDYNYYTKRILFNSAYAATELFMLTDQSPQRFATWQFLGRRMGDIQNMGKGIADVKVVGEALFDGALSLLNMFKTPQSYEHPIERAQDPKAAYTRNYPIDYYFPFSFSFPCWLDCRGPFCMIDETCIKIIRREMFFYAQSMECILAKQNFSAYIQSILVQQRSGQKVIPSPKLVQVVTGNSVSDGQFDYPCSFTSQKQKKGSFLRLTKWEVNTRTCELAIHEAQYLGGAGSEVKHGKKWDSQKLKSIAASTILSKHFVVLHQPTAGVEEKNFPKFDYSALCRALEKRAPPSSSVIEKQTFEKTTKPYAEQPDNGGVCLLESQRSLVSQQLAMNNPMHAEPTD